MELWIPQKYYAAEEMFLEQ